MKKFKAFQIRWKEPLGKPECPYLYRWTFLFFNYSIRIHQWIRSDVKTHFHDHACDFVSFVLWGRYYNIMPHKKVKVETGSIWKSKAEQPHYLEIPKGGAWTLLFCGPPKQRWGFFVDGKKWNPRKYFDKFGHPGCDIQ